MKKKKFVSCWWDSICNHSHPVKRSGDVIMEGAACHHYLIMHTELLTVIRSDRRRAAMFGGVQGGSPYLMGFSVLSLLPSKGSQAELAALTVTLPARGDWQMTEVFMQLGDQGCLSLPSLSTSAPAASPENQRSIIALALLQHPKGSLPAPPLTSSTRQTERLIVNDVELDCSAKA